MWRQIKLREMRCYPTTEPLAGHWV